MDAIQTFWSAPGLSVDRIYGGWLDPRYHFMSWALSACLLDQHLKKTVLHTDLAGRQILVDLFELPYQEVHLTQEGLDQRYPSAWWVLRKINSYEQQKPFLHVDGDAFLWNGLPEPLQETPIIAQNQQGGFACYTIAVNHFMAAGVQLPEFLGAPRTQYEAVNMGIVGGTDVAFFKAYVAEVRSFYETQLAGKNMDARAKGFLNTLLEECFFQHYAISLQKSVRCLIASKMNQGYKALGNLLDHSYGITHLIGNNKKDIFYCKLVEIELKRRFPKVFRRVVDVVENRWRHKTAFGVSGHEAFPESNILARKIDPDLSVTLENYEDVMAGHQHEINFRKMIQFEHAKYALFLDMLANDDEMDAAQQQRIRVLESLLDKSISERKEDQLCFSETIPLMSFQYQGKASTYYLATVYDFARGYQHIAHRPLDDLAIFILYASEMPVTLAAMIRQVAGKMGNGDDPHQLAKLIHQIDLKIKELVFLGLIDYQPATVPKDSHPLALKSDF